MTSRTFLIAFVLLLVISNSTNRPAFAQETSKQAAVKFDEFGDIQHSDLTARLDNYAIQLQNQLNVKAFVIVDLLQKWLRAEFKVVQPGNQVESQ